MLIGREGLECLQQSKVMIFGVGGVGSFTVEALARAGVGSLVLVDFDTVEATNINRQLPALHSTIGKYKVEVLAERIYDINPLAKAITYKEKVSRENVRAFFRENPSYVIDAIDMISGKLAIIETALQLKIPIISAMGAGNRLDPSKIKIGDISETAGSGCSLARVMRRELKKKGITQGVSVVYSTEQITRCVDNPVSRIPGSISFVPSVAGLFLAAKVVKDLLKQTEQ
ncbi:MAG: tRNA threonylcarbamoyladenosine dehydratase [Clostridia bacterium]|nr:tRNA threonylcarbamoyladenosine dehydratase [Clostridia bacterium]